MKNRNIRFSVILSKAVSYIFLIGILFFILYPFYLMLILSFKDYASFNNSAFGIPTKLYFGNYKTALIEGKMLLGFFNSLIVTAASIVAHIFICAGASFIVVRHEIKLFNIKINKILTLFFVFGSMVPPTAYMLPLFVTMKNIHLINNLLSLIIISVTLNIPLGVLMFSGFINTIHKDIEESATIDGCSLLRRFYSIMLPLLKPAIGTMAILVGLNTWNDFLFPLLFISKENLKTMTVKIFTFTGQYTNNWPVLSAAMVLCSIPMVILYLIRQKDFIKGVVSGAVKG